MLTLGGLTLTGGVRAASGAATQRRPLALLAILATSGDRGVTRDRLQALLWPESDAERARKVLAQTVYAIRRDLGDPGVVLGTTELRLNTALVSVDAIEFERAVADGAWERAAVLYAGPFLDGVHLGDAPEFERWCESERQRLGRRALDVLEHLARTSEAGGDWQVAAGWWRRRVALDPLCGPANARLMEALAAAGDVAGALRHARVYEALVREELGAPPDPVVSHLAVRLRTRASAALRPDAEEQGDAPPTPAAIPFATPTAQDGERAVPPHPDDDTAAPARSPDRVPVADGPPPPPDGARRWRARGGLGAALLLATVAVGAVLIRDDEPPTLDRTLVVVVPFDVADADPEIRLWREGMVDVLSRNLDGAGPLRTTSPTTVIREWTGHADRETVRAFAGAARAGTAVYGQVMRAGADSVRVAVTLLDAESGDVRVEIRREQSLSRMGQLTDSLTFDLLREIGRAVPVGAAPAVPLGGVSSLEALRAFLQGEQYYRRAAWDSAVGRYEHAVALDSAFALAWRRLGLVASWRRLQQDSLTSEYLLRAGAANDGLGLRDSLLVAADSLSAAADRSESVIDGFALRRRLFATLDAAERHYPDDPEVWFAVGEARYHFGFGPMVGVDERSTLDALDRAIALDSAFAPAYIHAVELGFNLGGAPLGLRYARAYLARNPTEAAHRGVLLMEPLVDPRRARSPAVARLLDTVQTSALVSARTILRRWPDEAETAVRLSRLLAAGRPSEYPLFADTSFMSRRLAEQLAFRGHLEEAAEVLGVRDHAIFAELAHLGAVPPLVAQPTFLRWARDGSGLARLALPFWSARRDTASLVAFLGGVRRRATRDVGGSGAAIAESRAQTAYDTAGALAHLALARGDSTRAVRRFLALPDTLCPECYLDRLIRARLLIANGRARDAMVVLGEPLDVFLTPVEVLFAIERARAAALLGDADGHRVACAFVRAAWRHADPQPRATAAEACRSDR